MIKRQNIGKHFLSTLILCLSLLVYTLPNSPVSANADTPMMSHQMDGTTMSMSMVDHCEDMVPNGGTVNCDDDNCSSNCPSTNGGVAFITTEMGLPRHHNKGGSFAIFQLSNLSKPSPTPPPII